jgi:hypothetical protein
MGKQQHALTRVLSPRCSCSCLPSALNDEVPNWNSVATAKDDRNERTVGGIGSVVLTVDRSSQGVPPNYDDKSLNDGWTRRQSPICEGRPHHSPFVGTRCEGSSQMDRSCHPSGCRLLVCEFEGHRCVVRTLHVQDETPSPSHTLCLGL